MDHASIYHSTNATDKLSIAKICQSAKILDGIILVKQVLYQFNLLRLCLDAHITVVMLPNFKPVRLWHDLLS